MEIKVCLSGGLYYPHSLSKNLDHQISLSEDVISTLNCLKKLGVKVSTKSFCEIVGLGLMGLDIKKI